MAAASEDAADRRCQRPGQHVLWSFVATFRYMLKSVCHYFAVKLFPAAIFSCQQLQFLSCTATLAFLNSADHALIPTEK